MGDMPQLSVNDNQNKLTMKQKLFAEKYVSNGFNGAQAANEVYNGSYNANKVLATRNLDKPAVIEEINKLLRGVNMDTDSWLADKLKLAVENGINQKLTAKDALNAINMIMKANESYPIKKSAHLRVNVNQNLPPKSVPELTNSVKTLSKKSNELLEDLKGT